MASMMRWLDLVGQEQEAAAFRRRNKNGCSLPLSTFQDTYQVLDEGRPVNSGIVASYF